MASTTSDLCPRQARTRDYCDTNNNNNSINHGLASDVHANLETHRSFLHRPPSAASRSSDLSEHSGVAFFEPPEREDVVDGCELDAAIAGQRAFVEGVAGSTDSGGWCKRSRVPKAGERVQVNDETD